MHYPNGTETKEGVEKTRYAQEDKATFELYYESGASEFSHQAMDASEIHKCTRNLMLDAVS
jgi:hypothetical protein